MGVNLSGLINAGTQALGTYEQSKAQAGQQQIGAIMQAIAMQRQQAKDDLAQAVAQSTIGKNSATVAHLGAQTAAMANPKPKMTPHAFMVDGQPTMGFADASGKFYDGTGQPVTGKVSPFVAQKPVAQGHVVDPVTGEVKFFDPTKPPTGLSINPKPQKEPQQSYTPFQGTDEQGKPVVRPFNTKTGQFGAVADVAPKLPAAAGGSASLSSEDRAKMLSQAQLDNETMKAYEQKVLSGKAHVGTAAGVAGATAESHGGTMANVMGVLGNAATGALDPDYQRYITAQRSYGRIMGNLQSKRYTDHQAEIERSISGLQGNDLAGTIQYKQALRDASLAEPANAPGGRGRGGAPSTGNIDLRQPAAPAKPAAKKDYGIFTPPGGE